MRKPLACTLLAMAAAVAAPYAAGQQDAPAGIPTAAVEREMLVRFSRAYGMAKGTLAEHGLASPSQGADAELLRDPEDLAPPVREEVYEIMDRNRVEPEEWHAMFARMDKDPELRDRIESLSTPFGY